MDFHAELTSEKMAMGWHLNGRVSAMLGTHTHIPTADERILAGGTAYQTDVGMTGPYDSVIGSDKNLALRRFLTAMPIRLDSAKSGAELHAAIVTVDPKTGHATAHPPLRTHWGLIGELQPRVARAGLPCDEQLEVARSCTSILALRITAAAASCQPHRGTGA